VALGVNRRESIASKPRAIKVRFVTEKNGMGKDIS
jgi:hypothetical protein